MNGSQVADAGRKARPGLKVLFVAGCAESGAAGRDQLDAGMEVLPEPFDLAALTAKVRRMLG